MEYACYTFPGYRVSEHLRLIAARLEAIERGEIKRLMIFAPPRHGKTETASIRFPAFYLARNPQAQIIACSYAESLAYSISYAVRETISSPQHQKLWATKLDRSGATKWALEGKTNKRASYIAAGVGGGIAGEGADCLLVDDAVKNREEAESPLMREKIWEWYCTVARTRLQPDAAIVLIMTRWHEADLSGRLLEQAKRDPQADQWEVLHLKAISEDGLALWPEQYPIEALNQIRASIGGAAFESLYQGNPSAATGNIFRREWWQYYSMRPAFKRVIHSWDTGFKVKAANDPSVCTVWGETQTGFYLLDVWRQRVEFPELKRVAIQMAERDHPSAILIEDKASGQSLLQELARDSHLPILPVKVDIDKVARANAVTPTVEAKRVYLPESAPWLHAYIEEMAGFPNAAHDDQVDSTTQALSWFLRAGLQFSARTGIKESMVGALA